MVCLAAVLHSKYSRWSRRDKHALAITLMKRCFECLYNLINFPSLSFLCRSRAGGVGGAATVPARLVSANMQNHKVQRIGDQANVPRLQGALSERDGERRHFQANLCAIFSSGRWVKAFLFAIQSISLAAVAVRLFEGVGFSIFVLTRVICNSNVLPSLTTRSLAWNIM